MPFRRAQLRRDIMKTGKWLIGICVIFLILFGLWEIKRLQEIPVPMAPPVAAPVVPSTPLSPVPPTPRPAPHQPDVKKLSPPVLVPKKAVSVKPAALPIPPTKKITTPTPTPVTPPPVFIPAPLPPEPQEWQGNDTSITHVGQVVIHNDRQWVHFWSEHHPHEAAPEIDFTKNMVIGVFAGPRPAEQFTILILGTRLLPSSLVIDYRERLPPPGTFAVNVTVYPYYLKVFPRVDLPVKFNLLPPENVVR
jgi:hypothetical protein